MCMCETQFEESLPGFPKINVIVKLFLTFALMTFIHSYLLWENSVEATGLDKRVSYYRVFITLIWKYTHERELMEGQLT